METTDWWQTQIAGMNGYEAVLKRHEAALLKLEGDLLDLRAGLRPGARLETVWFRRYAAVMLALLEVGLPEDLDVGEVEAWIRAAFGQARPEGGRLNGDGDGSARRDEGQTGNGTGCREDQDAPTTGCGACAHFNRCQWLIGAQADWECDWIPSRFRGKGC